jgi:hypothetical protein
MIRFSTHILIIAMLGACSNPAGSDPSKKIASNAHQQNGQGMLDASTSKGCGPDSLGGWPKSPITGGIVNNVERAKSLGQVYLISIYGKNVVTLPVSATLKNRVWTVVDAGVGKGAIGGERFIEICQSNGAVLQTYRTQ